MPPELVSKNGGPVRSALRKGAKVIAEQWKANIRGVVLEPNLDGLPTKSTGILEKSVRITRSKPPAGLKGEAVKIGIKRGQKYPVARGKGVTAAQVQRLLETGSEKMRPHPTIRPAFDVKKNEAVQVFVSDVNSRLVGLVKKLERENGAKS
jgi:HK97 gp10 family phage protein